MDGLFGVSVIIPAYNSSRFISSAIRSALNQTLSPKEIIVVDDGSTDDTSRVVRAFGDRVKYLSKENGGPSSARNVGMRAASGEFLAFLDADDEWEKGKLKACCEAIKAFDDVSPEIVFTDLTRWDWFSEAKYAKRNSDVYPYISYYVSEVRGDAHLLPRDRLFELLLRKYDIYPSTLLISRAVSKQVEWPEHRKLCEDFSFNLLLSLKSDAVYIDRTMSKLMRHDENLSRDYKSLSHVEVDVLSEFIEKAPLTVRQRKLARGYYGSRLCGSAYTYRKNEEFGNATWVYLSTLRYPQLFHVTARGLLLTFFDWAKTFIDSRRK